MLAGGLSGCARGLGGPFIGDRLLWCLGRLFDVPLEYGQHACLHGPDNRDVDPIVCETFYPLGADDLVTADHETSRLTPGVGVNHLNSLPLILSHQKFGLPTTVSTKPLIHIMDTICNRQTFRIQITPRKMFPTT